MAPPRGRCGSSRPRSVNMKHFPVAERLQNLPFSTIRRIFDTARELQRTGVDVARMEIGRPDFDTPQHIKNALVEALERGEVHYAPNRGIEPLRETIAEKLRIDNSIDVDPDNVLVTVGCKEAIFLSLAAYVDSGTEVLIPNPCWDTYSSTVTFFGGTPVSYPLDSQFQPDIDALEARITPKTGLMVIISPHNPTGAVWTAEKLKAMASLAKTHNLIAISDEIYEKLVYDNAEHVSIATMPGMKERTIIINGFSKAYSMDGWRIGYAAGTKALIDPLVKAHQYTTNCVTTFVQWGAIAAYEGDQKPVHNMRAEFNRRRRLVIEKLKSAPGVDLVTPEGAFYAFPRISIPKIAHSQTAQYILEKAGVACVPGDAFGREGTQHVRFSYATSYESIERGLRRLVSLLESHA